LPHPGTDKKLTPCFNIDEPGDSYLSIVVLSGQSAIFINKKPEEEKVADYR
jgi:hypothetical protein